MVETDKSNRHMFSLRKVFVGGAALILAGCTSVQVDDIDASEQMSHVCIEENPKVIVVDFLPVVRDGFTRHGITSEVYQGDAPGHCRYRLTYTALKTWDMAMYMHHAELRLYRGRSQIGYAEYHLNAGGGFALNKWASVESKMDPVLDEFLAAYTPEYVDTYRDEIDTSTSADDDNREKLEILKKWHEEGLISDKEYESEKKRIIDSM